jgi:6,7-dimethyl-8-ribityllumazine synthase
MAEIIKGNYDGKGYRIAIISSRFNEEITGNLIQGALKSLTGNGVSEKDIEIFYVPGAFEILPYWKESAQRTMFLSSMAFLQ